MSLFYNLIEIIACMLSYTYSLYVLSIFFKRSSHYKIWLIILFAIVYVPLTAVPSSDISNIIMSILSMVLIYIFSLICYQGNIFSKLFAIVIYNIFSILDTNVIFYIISIITGIPAQSLSSGTMARVYAIFTSYFVEFIILYMIKKFYKFSHGPLQADTLISFIFFLCDFTVCVLTHYVIFYIGDNKILLRICFVLSGLMLFSTLLVLYLLKQLQIKNQHDIENKMLSLQISEQKNLFDQMLQNEEKVQSIRHDMKNFLLQYKILLDEGNVVEVQKDLEKMLGKRLLPALASYTKNPSLNALLTYKYDIAKKHNIPFKIHVVIDPDYKNLELMIALSNLIDNAIDAEQLMPEQYRSISVEIIQTENKLSILIMNKIPTSILAKNPTLHTTKSEDGIHGIGLKNVKQIVDSQEGLIDIFEENGCFCVHLFFS